MSELTPLEIVSRFAPGMAIVDALAMVTEIRESLPVPLPIVTVSDPAKVAEATLWAERNFGPENQPRKIRCIKELRDRFGIGLREGKAIAETVAYDGWGVMFD